MDDPEHIRSKMSSPASKSQFHYHHSWVVDSETKLPRVLRTGWITFDGKPASHYFIWRSYYRLADIVTQWFIFHGLPYSYCQGYPGGTEQYIPFFRNVFYKLANMIRDKGASIERCYKFESDCFKDVFVCGYGRDVDSTLLVDEDTMYWVLNLLIEWPSSFFKTFIRQVKAYKESSGQLCAKIMHILPQEEFILDGHVRSYYQNIQWYDNRNRKPTRQHILPISYHAAVTLRDIRANQMDKNNK